MSEEERIEAAEAEVSVFTRLERSIMNRRNEFDLLFEWILHSKRDSLDRFKYFFGSHPPTVILVISNDGRSSQLLQCPISTCGSLS